MSKPLDQCCNGCNAKPQPPSLVLCKDCVQAITEKFEALAKKYKEIDREQARVKGQGTSR